MYSHFTSSQIIPLCDAGRAFHQGLHTQQVWPLFVQSEDFQPSSPAPLFSESLSKNAPTPERKDVKTNNSGN